MTTTIDAGCDCDRDGPEHFGSTKESVSTKPWDGSASRYSDPQYQKATAACDPGDGTVKNRCFLPHHEPDGTINRNGVHAAAQRAGALKGHDPGAVARAKAHLRSHYSALGEKPPDSIAATAEDLATFDAPPGVMPDQRPQLPPRPQPRPVDPDGDDDMGGRVVTDDEGNVLPTRWHAVAAPEGVMTGDRRMFAPGALGSRPLPLPLKYQDATSSGHEGAQTAGTIDNIERRPGYVYAEGSYDLGSPVGREAARQALKQQNRFVSVDLTDVDAEHVTGPDVDPDDLLSLLIDEGGYDLIHQGNIAAITQCSIPAFHQAVIAPHDQDLDLSGIPAPGAGQPLGLVSAAAMRRPELPPAEWFADPHLTGPTHLTVTDDGRIYGHLATWDQPHVGLPGRVYAPRSQSAYAYFRTGATRAANDDGATVDVPTGVLTVGTGHADTRLGHRPASEHYDHTGCGVADVAAGEDRHGIWLAGAVRPGATDAQVRTLRASDVSGDWRTIGGRLELVAALVVNVPGFPVPRALAAAAQLDDGDAALESGRPRWGEVDGQQVSLVAAGVLHNDPVRTALARIVRQLAAHAVILEALRPVAAEQLALRAAAAFDSLEV